MSELQYNLVHQPWPLIFICLYIVLYIVFICKDTKSSTTFIKSVASCGYTDDEIVRKIERYIAKHPFSLFNSVLRLGMLPLLIALCDENEVNKTISKIRMVDLRSNSYSLVFYSLFLLKEYGYENQYIELCNKISKLDKTLLDTDVALLITGEKIPATLLDFSDDKKLEFFIQQYYLGKQHLELNDLEKASSCFATVNENHPGNALYFLMKRKGYMK